MLIAPSGSVVVSLLQIFLAKAIALLLVRLPAGIHCVSGHPAKPFLALAARPRSLLWRGVGAWLNYLDTPLKHRLNRVCLTRMRCLDVPESGAS